MRDYGAVSPRFWTGKTGKALRGHHEAQIVALYLMTCPGSHMIGLYSLAIPTLCHETGLTHEGASKGLLELEKGGFAHYDADTEVVFVPEMARFQIGLKLTHGDKRIIGVERELENFRMCKFFNDFLDRYAQDFHLKVQRNPEAPSEGLASPSQAPRKPRQDQDQDQDQSHQRGGVLSLIPPPAPSPLVAFILATWPGSKLEPARLATWEGLAREKCPGVDLLAEARAARMWELENPTQVRVNKPSFLGRWFRKEQDKLAGALRNSAPARPGAHVAASSTTRATPGRKFFNPPGGAK